MDSQTSENTKKNMDKNKKQGFEMSVKERPIIFNTEMVKAILEDRKTRTCRPVKGPYLSMLLTGQWDEGQFVQDAYGDTFPIIDICPYGKVGDRLWVRETFLDGYAVGGPKNFDKNGDIVGDETIDVIYKADSLCKAKDSSICWKPSIHMPRWASRITLEITDVRVERVQDISDKDILSEGINPVRWSDNKISNVATLNDFVNLWNSIYKPPYDWASNPWVWVIEFKRCDHV